MDQEAFSRQARSLLNAVGGAASRARWQTYTVGDERIVLLESGHLPAGSEIDAILVVRGDFSCGARCHFTRPVYVGGNCEIGKGSRLESVAADGALTLCPAVEASSWVRSAGPMELRSLSKVAGAATSDTSVRLSVRASAAQLLAPQVSTPNGDGDGDIPVIEPSRAIELLAPGSKRRPIERVPAGMTPSRLNPVGAETWFYDGDLHLIEPVVLRAHLVTRGYFSCAAGSLLDGDVKSGSALYVGERCIVRQHLSARGDLVLEAGTAFQGNLASQQRIRLCAGVRGLREAGPVDARAGGSILLEDGVMVRGKLSAQRKVVSVASERVAAPDLLVSSM